MLLAALADRRLRPGKTGLDSSSGNVGIAYAMIGQIVGPPVGIVDPGQCRHRGEEAPLGARLIFTDAIEGDDEALREVRRRYEANPDHYFSFDQYSNEDNWRAH